MFDLHGTDGLSAFQDLGSRTLNERLYRVACVFRYAEGGLSPLHSIEYNRAHRGRNMRGQSGCIPLKISHRINWQNDVQYAWNHTPTQARIYQYTGGPCASHSAACVEDEV